MRPHLFDTLGLDAVVPCLLPWLAQLAIFPLNPCNVVEVCDIPPSRCHDETTNETKFFFFFFLSLFMMVQILCELKRCKRPLLATKTHGGYLAMSRSLAEAHGLAYRARFSQRLFWVSDFKVLLSGCLDICLLAALFFFFFWLYSGWSLGSRFGLAVFSTPSWPRLAVAVACLFFWLGLEVWFTEVSWSPLCAGSFAWGAFLGYHYCCFDGIRYYSRESNHCCESDTYHWGS